MRVKILGACVVVLGLLAAAGLATAGKGKSSKAPTQKDRVKAKKVLREYAQAYVRKDGEKLCSLVTKHVREWYAQLNIPGAEDNCQSKAGLSAQVVEPGDGTTYSGKLRVKVRIDSFKEWPSGRLVRELSGSIEFKIKDGRESLWTGAAVPIVKEGGKWLLNQSIDCAVEPC